MKDIIFSIIIPVYNSSKYLTDCLESVAGQTYKKIEIICIDDASVDESLRILEQYSKKDERIRVIAKSKNEGTSKARKDGVLCSGGEHILFVDADDQLASNTCERLLEVFEKRKSDIIQFAACVRGCEGVGEERTAAMKKYFQPVCQNISIQEAQKLCFYSGKLAHNLCGKMFNGEICRKAFSYISNDRIIIAEDLYAYFIISMLSKSYMGIHDELYLYNFGSGITGENKDFFETLENYCLQSQVCQKCYDFLVDFGKLEEYESYVGKIRNRLFQTCINYFWNSEKKIKQEEIPAVQKLFSENWNLEELGYLVAVLEMKYQDQAAKCQHSNLLIKEKGWIFPYERIPRGAKVIIYGAGDMGKDYYNQLIKSDYCEVAAWVDRAYDTLECSTRDKVSPPESIISAEYDYIVIAIRNRKTKSTIVEYLLGIGVQKEAII